MKIMHAQKSFGLYMTTSIQMIVILEWRLKQQDTSSVAKCFKTKYFFAKYHNLIKDLN